MTNPSIDYFPFNKFKAGQGLALHYLTKKRFSLIQAPTGFGKSAVSLSVVLPELQQGRQIIIATRTKSQIFEIFFKWLARFSEHKEVLTHITCLPLIAREDLCITRSDPNAVLPECQDCSLKKKTEQVTRSNFSVFAPSLRFSATSPALWRKNLSHWGCPYQLIKGLCPFIDIVLTTQGYLIQPHLRNTLFRLTHADQEPDKKVLLLDEAHGFAQPTVVAELELDTLHKAAQVYSSPVLARFVERCTYPGLVSRPAIKPTELATFLSKDRWGWKRKRFQPVVALYEFLRNEGECWVRTEEHVVQVNPFPETTFEAFKDFAKVIGMSGTFMPLKEYQALFNVGNYHALDVSRPVKRQFLAVSTELCFSTKFEQRTAQTYRVYAQAIKALHTLNPEHTLVCLPSHDVKDHITQYFETSYIEEQGVLPTWLDELATLNHELIFCVMGGRVSEGVEILDPHTKKSKITLIILAGLPFPAKAVLNEVLMYLYEQRYSTQRAEQYLVQLPMFEKVVQAMGRGIRSPRDYTAVVILDYRAADLVLGEHQKLYSQLNVLKRDLSEFYQQQDLKNDMGSL